MLAMFPALCSITVLVICFALFFSHCTVQQVGSQLPDQGQAWVPCTSSMEPQLLDYRGTPPIQCVLSSLCL